MSGRVNELTSNELKSLLVDKLTCGRVNKFNVLTIMLVYNFTSSQVNELSDYPLTSGKFTSHITPLSPWRGAGGEAERGWG